jgi:glycosyltransferase involved in cell wall biosynthesis
MTTQPPLESFGEERARERNPFSPKGSLPRILLLNYEYPPLGGGAGNATANLARELAGLGHEIRVITAAFGDLPRRERVDGFEVRRIPAVRRHADHCSPLEMLSFLASAMVALPVLARSWRPDACIAFFGIPCGPAAWLLKVLCGVPYVVSLRGGDVPGFQPYDLAAYHRLTAPLIRFLWNQAAHVVANSRGLAALAAKSAGATPIALIPNGVDAARFTPTEEASREGPVRFVFVGRLVRQKGLDVLLEALSRLPRQACFEVAIIGDGPLKAELTAMAARLSLVEVVRFLGWVSRADMPEVLRRADAFVFPSRDEGMPNAVLEAMASGLAVAATAIAGNEELVEDGRTGFLVPPEDVAALAEVLTRLAGDRNLCWRLGRAGREKVVRDYSWRAVAEAYAALCRPAVR